MTQQGWIGVTIVIGFIVFVTIRGDLPAFRQVLTTTTPTAQQQSVTAAQQGGMPEIANILKGYNL